MFKVGSIVDLKLGSENTAVAIVPRSDNPEHNLVLGQYVLVGRGGAQRQILARVVGLRPDFGEAGRDYSEAVRQAMDDNKRVDSVYSKQLSYLRYECKLLGVCTTNDSNKVEFYSDVRNFPAIYDLEVFIPNPDFMRALMRTAVQPKGDEPIAEFTLGNLAYGSDPANTSQYAGENAVPVMFNVLNLCRKRTMAVGKSGYGKSNLTKNLVGAVAKAASGVGQLLIDTNNEYSLDNTQNDGFLDIFHQAGMPNKVIMFTNRKLPESIMRKYEHNIRALKIDAYTEPSTVFAMVAESVRLQIKNSELPKYLIKWANGAEVDDDNTAWEGSGEIRALYYAALMNEGIRPASERQRSEIGLKFGTEFASYLLFGELPAEEEGEDGKSDRDLTPNDRVRLKEEFFAMPDGRLFYTNHIGTMAAFGKWFAAKEKTEKETEFKDYCDLVLKYSYRLSSIKKIHISSAKDSGHTSLSTAVFKSLCEGKIVILDLAMESIKVADVLTRHILSHLFNRMVEDFGRPEVSAKFDKRDFIVYIEEAQNFLSDKNIGQGSIYERIVKEGRKFHIATVYITQQPSAISLSITSQTENIFALHMSNEGDTSVLHKIKDKYDELTCRFIKDEAAQGLCYCFSEPYQPFVLSVQLHKFSKELISG